MTSPQRISVMLAAFGIGGITAAFLLQRQETAKLRVGNETLQQQSKQMAALCANFRQIWSQAIGEASSHRTETVAIDCAEDRGEVSHCGSGFLYGFSADGLEPPDSAVAPLNIRLHRTRIEHTLAQAQRLKALGIQQQVVLSDAWGYGDAHPGDYGNWNKWEKFIRRQLDLVRQAGVQVQFDIWNEPDHGRFWNRTAEQFLETWTRAYRTLRAADPSAIIVGPSWSAVRPGEPRFDNFLLHCKAHHVLPDYITWHFPKDTVAEARACREFCAREGIRVRGIMINEYCGAYEQTPANTAWLLAQLERARVDGACHAIWDERTHNNLDGILAADGPRGRWWVYRRYAEMEGRLRVSTPSANVEALAAADSAARKFRILLGRQGGAGLRLILRLDRLGALPFPGCEQLVQVKVEQIPDSEAGTVTNLPVLFNGTVAAPGGHAEILIPWLNPGDAFAVVISPVDRSLAER
ncbi:MAG TPA: hypothetical protein VN829_21935 [Dongiaceae bacterium]|nr:hypothetical protein [Dongiaceae bacterium]